MQPILTALLEQIDDLSEGDLNYIITKTVHVYLRQRAIGYTNYNSAIGVLECAKLELYRRRVVPYEENKILENGDV